MKKFVSMALALVLTMAMAVPVFAANTITSDESHVYDEFVRVVDKWDHFSKKATERGEQYKSMARNALLAADLSKSACDDLLACVYRVDEYITSKNPTSAGDMRDLAFDVVPIVNATSNKYGLKVDLGSTTFSQVLILKDGKYVPVTDIVNNGGGSGNDDSGIRQTGYSLTATFVVFAMLVAALGVSFAVVGKKRLVVNPAE